MGVPGSPEGATSPGGPGWQGPISAEADQVRGLARANDLLGESRTTRCLGPAVGLTLRHGADLRAPRGP
eukprot:5180602-Alexandrium_andersonii.AAC.1